MGGLCCLQAILNIISNPVNSTVPIAAEVLKAAGVYDKKKVSRPAWSWFDALLCRPAELTCTTVCCLISPLWHDSLAGLALIEEELFTSAGLVLRCAPGMATQSSSQQPIA